MFCLGSSTVLFISDVCIVFLIHRPIPVAIGSLIVSVVTLFKLLNLDLKLNCLFLPTVPKTEQVSANTELLIRINIVTMTSAITNFFFN